MAPHDNNSLCGLYRIPEELVLEICELLVGSDVYIMRQTCRKLRRILSSPQFVISTTWIDERRVADLPSLATDWGDVLERLRRRQFCSSCTNVRFAALAGAQSTYDKVMSRMVNNFKFCVSCQVSHPLIMFSHFQRNLSGDESMCILGEGGIMVCPHFTLSMAKIENWRGSVPEGSRAKVFKCNECFSGMNGSVPPSVTWWPSYWPPHFCGRVDIHWAFPLKLGKKELSYVKRAMTRGLDGVSAAQALRKALSKAAGDYDHLLCPHQSFNDRRFLDMFKRAYPYKSQRFPLPVHQLRVGYHAERLQTCTENPEGPARNSEFRGETCKYCNPFNSTWGCRTTWSWILGGRGDDCLYLQRTFVVYIPGLKFYSPRRFDDWTQMLPPPSYGLPQDEELRHITWCPDKTCAKGKSWDNHCRVLRKVWHLFTDQLLPLTSKPAVRPFDVSAPRVEDPCQYVKEMPKPGRRIRRGMRLAK
ncbi:hypothetical protein PG984_013543 [Apiospora sp. TS-2023a]